MNFKYNITNLAQNHIRNVNKVLKNFSFKIRKIFLHSQIYRGKKIGLRANPTNKDF